ncbi:MAG TPA: 16S rRNA (cytosine(1402)-N(4))-methyltransferase [Gammaproteobacteria bacterium]|nr:16S rRNA (cytosine(1402)-N(4))-methyltransferase [Gammaproteobacteria bacterium]
MKGLAHIPVLLNEAIQALAIKPDGNYIDGTFGRGGHSKKILSALSVKGRLLALDRDPAAIKVGEALAKQEPRFMIEQCLFGELIHPINKRLWGGKVDGILLDIGVSSPQLDQAERGFSFLHDGPLDMRMDPSQGQSAATWLAIAEQSDITRVLREYGEERFAKRIASAIVTSRSDTPLKTTSQLARLIEQASPIREKHKHPATRSFQAIRIYINDELGQLQRGLIQAIEQLAIGGRLAVICFHSLEDRLVKRFFREQAKGDDFPSHFPIQADQLTPTIKPIGKAIKAGPEELAQNPRARSAVLRVVEKIA